MNLGTYTLDTLQIYFPWDDDLYTFLKERGFMSKNPEMKVLPLVYSDNCISTQGVEKIKRNYVIDPKLYGMDESKLGWQRVGKKDFIIPAEHPQLQVTGDDKTIQLKIIPKVDGKNEYHIEFSVMSAFGKMYSNWVALYLSLKDGKELINKAISSYGEFHFGDKEILELNVESKQNQREQMHWTFVPLSSYRFSIQEFEYVAEYLRHSGVKPPMPALVYDSINENHAKVMKPYIKLGIVETTEKEGFRQRNSQLAIKLAQDKMIIGKRGKKVKLKGIIDEDGPAENYIILPTKVFVASLNRIKLWYNMQPRHNLKI